jgi:membrane protein implicated in regulation of membrane protease activity
MEFLFAGIMLAGLLYIVLSIVGLTDALDFINVDGAFGAADLDGLGCSLVAVFMAGFGALGLTGSLLQWNPILTLIAALAVGVVLGRVGMEVLRFVRKQQSAPVTFSSEDLIGQSGRVTIDSPPGKTGEVMVEADTIIKYAVKEINGAALQRGDVVEIVDVDGRVLRVKKKRS